MMAPSLGTGVNAALVFAFACYGAALLLNLAHLLRAPAMADKLLALDTMTLNAIALLILYGLARQSPFAFEPALLLAMFGFVGTIAFAKHLLRGVVIA